MGITYGKGFQGIQELFSFKNGSQAKISIDRSLADQRYCFHPVLLDACLQSIGAAFPEIHGQELHLPYGFSSLELFRNPDDQVWTQVDVKSDSQGEMCVDVNIYNQEKQLCARFTNLTARRTKPEVLQRLWQETEKNCFYQVQWQKLALLPTVTNNLNNSWLIFVHPQTALNPLVNLLKKAGEKVIIVEIGNNYKCHSQDYFAINPAEKNDFQRLYQQAYPSGEFPTGVIFSWETGSVAEDIESVYTSCHAALNLIQNLTNNWQKLPDLWLITRGANQVLEDPSLDPQQSYLWGLGAVINQEYPQMRCVCLDLSTTAEADEAELLFNQLHTSNNELRLALRRGNRYGARLVSATIPPAQKQQFVSKEGAYLITGGLGKLGLLVAEWLSKMGASHLVLCSRNIKAQPELIAAFAEKGTEITIIGIDISFPPRDGTIILSFWCRFTIFTRGNSCCGCLG
ncbi:MAG: polyketide synthase dehydratase domain-containing protein [Planktothrix sp. GU0601_MAG3]|nr:MAG: polyketide synthase dehydratase domain-containing protein [Planktothrix sp. GU0601_MAG3]